MRLCSLNHLLGELQSREKCERIVILGSASLLAHFPEIGEQGCPLETTCDADFLLKPVNKEIALRLASELGINAAFHAEHGYHADILHPTIVEGLPPGWDERLVAMEGFENVFALDPYDLAAVKVVVGREKDLALVRGLLGLGKITAEKLRERLHAMPLGEKEMFRAGRNFSDLIAP
jgi:hypothetical protein